MKYLKKIILLFSCLSQKNSVPMTVPTMNTTFPSSYSAPMDAHGTTVLLTLEVAERFRQQIASYENLNTKDWHEMYTSFTGKYTRRRKMDFQRASFLFLGF
jgi:hypothetical protein